MARAVSRSRQTQGCSDEDRIGGKELKVIFFFSTKDLTGEILKDLSTLILQVFSQDPSISFEKIFVEDNPSLAKTYNITGTPITIIGDKRFPGVATLDQILKMKGHTIDKDTSVQARPGATILVGGTAQSKLLTMIKDMDRSSRKLLYITKTYPEALTRYYGLEKEEMIWLLPKAVDYMSISMTDIKRIKAVLFDFLEKNERAVIVLEGLEVLLMHNPMEPVLDMVRELKAIVEKQRATAYILFLPNAIKENACVEIRKLFED